MRLRLLILRWRMPFTEIVVLFPYYVKNTCLKIASMLQHRGDFLSFTGHLMGVREIGDSEGAPTDFVFSANNRSQRKNKMGAPFTLRQYISFWLLLHIK